jgi:hypothetical protein
MLIVALEDSKLTKQDIYLLYIDLKNVIGSIDHVKLLAIMANLGYPHDAINLIGNIYTHSSTSFFGTYFGRINSVHIQRGTIQGDSLNPYFFIIFLEPLLRWLERDNHSYSFKISKSTIRSAAYVDNLVILTDNINSIQPQINRIDKFCKWIGMDLRITKCAITECHNSKY